MDRGHDLGHVLDRTAVRFARHRNCISHDVITTTTRNLQTCQQQEETAEYPGVPSHFLWCDDLGDSEKGQRKQHGNEGFVELLFNG